eukprot:1808977-Amphidinium_carterae.1
MPTQFLTLPSTCRRMALVNFVTFQKLTIEVVENKQNGGSKPITYQYFACETCLYQILTPRYHSQTLNGFPHVSARPAAEPRTLASKVEDLLTAEDNTQG